MCAPIRALAGKADACKRVSRMNIVFPTEVNNARAIKKNFRIKLHKNLCIQIIMGQIALIITYQNCLHFYIFSDECFL